MADLLIGLGRSNLGHFAIGSMSDPTENQWRQRHQFYDQVRIPGGDWSSNTADHTSSIQDMDMRMFQPETTASYAPPYSVTQARMGPPNLAYTESWASDMEIGTPSTAAFPFNDLQDTFSDPTSNPALDHLRAPALSHHSTRSPQSGVSPSLSPSIGIDRPTVGRSITDPSHQFAKASSSRVVDTLPKRDGSVSDDEDDDENPPKEDPKARGRKRQRIPHTAVERRYRENLNAHLEKLRQAVPALAARKSSSGGGGKDTSEGLKTSKCEILSGAIDHIAMLDKENAALKNEVRSLRTTVAEFNAWYRAHGR